MEQYGRKHQIITEHDACGIGLIVNIDGHQDHQVVNDALSIVEKLDHRAGKDASGQVGDGVGILLQISHKFFKRIAGDLDIELQGERDYGVGMIFFPQDRITRLFSKRRFEVIAEKNGLQVKGWRNVPCNPGVLGERARQSMPYIMQVFIERPSDCEKGIAFDRILYAARREFEQGNDETYIVSLSSRTVVYKGMFLVNQLRQFYPDLSDPDYESAIALVHSRFSTNTNPSWNRAHPYRMIAHNGEINTISGNRDRMLAREETMHSEKLEPYFDQIYPVINSEGSDSAMVDNTLEFMYMSGMDLPLALMIMIPEPWKNNASMAEDKKDFYHYYATMMEPWDGPAAILFSDGDIVGACLDRNGLRPSRYYVTDDGRLILASEVGVLDVDEAHIIKKSRLMPGKLLLADTKQKKIIGDEEIKEKYVSAKPYGEWLNMHLRRLGDLKIPNHKLPGHTQKERDRLYKVFGYSYEDVRNIILKMAVNGAEPTGSMGHDIPLAMFSQRHESLFSYFYQRFAQVTNPPIDSIREKVVTDTTVYAGSDGNLLMEKGENCSVLEINNPILTGTDMMKIKALKDKHLKSETVSILFYKHTPLEKAIDQLCIRCDRAYKNGANILILSDRGVDENHVPIPSLMAVSAVEQHMVRTKKCTQISLMIESGEPFDVHQCAALLAFGAKAVYPYLAHECIVEMIDLKLMDKEYSVAVHDYNKAVVSGITKIAAKMGVSIIQSYQSAKLFEAIGLDRDVVDRYFTGIVASGGGVGLKEIEDDIIYRHDHAFDPFGLSVDTTLDSIGYHGLRSNDTAEEHLYSPQAIVALQEAVREGSYDKFREYTDILESMQPHRIRDVFELVPAGRPLPLEEVEPAEEIVKRFSTGAMSFGSISKEAHETLARAMNALHAKSNTGEGGEDPERFNTDRNCAIKQVASGRFGVTSQYLNAAQEIQIKMAQGAKPGEGGHLPGEKVYPWVASTRYATPGVSLISPPPHHDIYSIEDLAQLIYDLKNVNRDARISVKLVSEDGVGTVACGVAKGGAQVVLISGNDGGTGAAPFSSIHHAGMPWELGVAQAHQALIENGLREKVILATDGKLMSGRDVAVACLLGAEEFSFATGPLVAMGCTMMRVCSKDTCPFGIATQNETLRRRFRGKPEHVINYMMFIAEHLRELMAYLGFRTINEMIGRRECLRVAGEYEKTKLNSLCVSPLTDEGLHFDPKQAYDFHLENTPDLRVLVPWFEKARKNGKKHSIDIRVSATDRAFGTILGSCITRAYDKPVADDTFTVNCTGGGGQSFGAFIPKGLTLRLSGDVNDYTGKGLSGGKIIVTVPEKAKYRSDENMIAGNVALYGATSGKAFFQGVVGERFCVRNSGATAVCEGCGDHGLEYMTGGVAVILGETGKNFAAGMSGGVAYVLDDQHTLYRRMSSEQLIMKEVSDKYDILQLQEILEEYVQATGSPLAGNILAHMDEYASRFKKIIPVAYARMIERISHYEEQGIGSENAVMEAFLDSCGRE